MGRSQHIEAGCLTQLYLSSDMVGARGSPQQISTVHHVHIQCILCNLTNAVTVTLSCHQGQSD